MDELYIRKILTDFASGNIDEDTAYKTLLENGVDNLGYARIDQQRESRCGFPEVVYGEGKTAEQIAEIMGKLFENCTSNIIATRCSAEKYAIIKKLLPEACYHNNARIISLIHKGYKKVGLVAVLCAGTSDLPIAEEAAVTAELMGSHVERCYDVGVAGIHRLLNATPILKRAKAVVAVAGMEGALASVVGGLTPAPVIAVPTSIGYGASFGGLAALLTMLNSCASGVGVVNIDNGFGGGYLAAMINKQSCSEKSGCNNINI